jgi:hypothetical protein
MPAKSRWMSITDCTNVGALDRGSAMTQSENKAQPGGQTGASAAPSILNRVLGFDSWIRSAASLSILTLIAGWFGTYIQYLNAYEQKVSATAQADMTAATGTFLEISGAYAEAQLQQQLIYFSFRDAWKANASAGEKKMATTTAQTGYPEYVKARNALRQNSIGYARKAELYIDWASDIGRDAAETKAIDGDPLTESALGVYDLDCDAPANFAHYQYDKDGKVDVSADDDRIERGFCADPNQKDKQVAYKSHTVLCIYDDNKKAIDHGKSSLIINWHSAKHHLLVMQYCFDGVHGEIATARTWASNNEISDEEKTKFLADPDRHQASLDNEVVRLDKFMSLVMSQLERIRVKYRPSSFYCNLPLINHLISNRCMPVRIAESKTKE